MTVKNRCAISLFVYSVRQQLAGQVVLQWRIQMEYHFFLTQDGITGTQGFIDGLVFFQGPLYDAFFAQGNERKITAADAVIFDDMVKMFVFCRGNDDVMKFHIEDIVFIGRLMVVYGFFLELQIFLEHGHFTAGRIRGIAGCQEGCAIPLDGTAELVEFDDFPAGHFVELESPAGENIDEIFLAEAQKCVADRRTRHIQ